MLAISTITAHDHKLQFKNIELQDTSAKLKLLQQQYDVQLKSKNVDEKKLQDLEKQKQDLEKQLSAKQEAKRIADEAANKAAQELANTATLTKTAYAAPASYGSHTDMLAAAGIAPSDWAAADFIIMHEGHYDPCVWNGGYSSCDYRVYGDSKAYGVCQSFPGSKMASVGGDWLTNPITQLRWCDSYAKSKFGGWWSAYSYWKAHSNW